MILLVLSTKKLFCIRVANLKQKKKNRKKNQKKNLKSTLITLSLLLKKNQKTLIMICLRKTSSQNKATINLKFQLQLGMILLISDFQDYFEFIIKKPETLSEDLPIEIYPNKLKTELFSK